MPVVKRNWSFGEWKHAKLPRPDLFGAIVERYDGKISARELVEEARSRRSPIHKGFTWNDIRAGELYREEEARGYLRHLILVETRPRKRPRVVEELVALPGSGEKGSGRRYTTVETALETAPQSLDQALDELRRFVDGLERRYGRIAKRLAPILAKIRKAVA